MDQKMKRAANTFAALLAGLGGVVALAVWSENANRQAHISQLDQSLRQSTIAIGQHITDGIEMAELGIVALKSEIERNRTAPDLKERTSQFIAHLTEHTPHLTNLIYIDRHGNLVATNVDAVTLKGADPVFTDRDYFKYHLSDASEETYIGTPVLSRLTDSMIVPISQRLEDASGQFDGIVAADIPITHINAMIDNMIVTEDASVLIAREDGTVIVRWPETNPELANLWTVRNLAFSALVDDATRGIVVKAWPTDGLSRHNAAFSNHHPGITVLVGARETAVLWQWVNASKIRWILSGILILMALILILRWRYQTLANIRNNSMLQRREAEFELLAEASADLIERLTPDGIREYASPASRQILGLAPETLIGRSVLDFVPPQEKALAKTSLERLQEGATLQRVLIRYDHPEGRETWLETTLSRLNTRKLGPSAIVSITRDVTPQKQRYDELNTLASTDPLTGLANRRSFDRRLDELVADAHLNAAGFSLLIVDADRFKLYNDTYGHASGDACLKAIAAGIAQSVRRADLAARYGGEEFAVLMPMTDVAGAKLVAEKIRQKIASLRLPHERNQPYGIATVSIGVASWQPSAPEADGNALFSRADAALYEAKNIGRNRVVLSSASEETSRVGTVISA
ncbi:diguanylate cyclase [Rhizobium sp. FY34]|uniref:sensor domain-containing diguanylate cyclase n=1 Tax=Rhizobium sp. FY34 TaxID=2562309 RepID=UPI0010C12C80|nr:diguanylate cyclase [Rhizobium sp. FY34]